MTGTRSRLERRDILTAGGLLAWNFLSRKRLTPPFVRGPGNGAQILVTEFGARGDGRADDAPAIQTAVDEGVRTGAVVFFPPGDYLVTSTIRVRGPATLVGANMAANLRAASARLDYLEEERLLAERTAVSALLYVMPGVAGVHIERLSLVGAWQGGRSDITHNLLLGDNTRDCRIAGCRSTAGSWSGICARGSGHDLVSNTCTNNATDGIEVWGNGILVAENRTMRNGLSSTPGVAGIEVVSVDGSNLEDVAVVDNRCDSDRTGISATGGRVVGLMICRNRVSRTLERGINIGNARGHAEVTLLGNHVRDTTASGALGHGIVVNGPVEDFLIAENIVTGCNHGDGPSGIAIEGACRRGTVTANITVRNWVGISESGAPETSIYGNIARQNRGADLWRRASGVMTEAAQRMPGQTRQWQLLAPWRGTVRSGTAPEPLPVADASTGTTRVVLQSGRIVSVAVVLDRPLATGVLRFAMQRSMDGGEHWQALSPGIEGSVGSRRVHLVQFEDRNAAVNASDLLRIMCAAESTTAPDVAVEVTVALEGA